MSHGLPLSAHAQRGASDSSSVETSSNLVENLVTFPDPSPFNKFVREGGV